jgi:hypothetical protein
MKHLILFAVAFTIIGFSSCKEDDPVGTLTIHFRATYDGQPLQTFTTHPFEGVQQLQFTNLSMMVSDLQLIDGSSTRDLDDVELVDMSFDNLAGAEAGYTLQIPNVKVANYDAIRFGIGVPPDLNAKTPADFPSSSPLSKTSYYWIAWNSYIFSKTEGRLDTLGNGALDLGFALHTGSDALYWVGEGPVPIVIEEGKVTTLSVLIDYKKVLTGVDIKSHPQNHTQTDTSEIVKIVNNYGSSITLSL